MPLIISDEILSQIQLTEDEFIIEVAVALYAQKRFSIGQAARFAGKSIFDMHQILKDHDVPLNISPQDVVDDWKTMQKF